MPIEFKRLAIVGFGTLGAQIAAQAVLSGYEVAAYDPSPDALQRALDSLEGVEPAMINTPSIDVSAWPASLAKVKIADSLAEAVKNADLVIEAVPEDLELKLAVWRDLDKFAPEHAVLATNSSSMPVSKLENATQRPEKCLNIHVYMLTVGHAMADLMGGSKTAPEVIEAGGAFIESIGLTHLTVKKELLGFCFNRIWRAIKREALYMWAGGFVDFKDIDRGYMIFNNIELGPFGMMDAVGLDTVWNIEMVYYNESRDPKDHPPRALKDMIDAGRLGRKSGQGFYSYPNPAYKEPNFLKP